MKKTRTAPPPVDLDRPSNRRRRSATADDRPRRTRELDALLEKVCLAAGLRPDRVRSPSRQAKLVDARRTYFLLARRNTNATLKEIGERCGRKHADVIHGLRRACDLLDVGDRALGRLCRNLGLERPTPPRNKNRNR